VLDTEDHVYWTGSCRVFDNEDHVICWTLRTTCIGQLGSCRVFDNEDHVMCWTLRTTCIGQLGSCRV
jgi:hypothetical protein